MGDILVEKGYLSREGLDRALSMQKVFRGEYGASESLKQKTDYLRHVHLFNELTEADLRTLAVVCFQESFDQGHILFAEGEPGDALYVVTSGAVRLVKSSPRGEEQELAVMGTGDFFGEMALVDQGPRSATAIVQRHGALLVLPKAQLDRLLDEATSSRSSSTRFSPRRSVSGSGMRTSRWRRWRRICIRPGEGSFSRSLILKVL